jgi:hypothetical protein
MKLFKGYVVRVVRLVLGCKRKYTTLTQKFQENFRENIRTLQFFDFPLVNYRKLNWSASCESKGPFSQKYFFNMRFC